jgi:hypothetical protein
VGTHPAVGEFAAMVRQYSGGVHQEFIVQSGFVNQSEHYTFGSRRATYISQTYKKYFFHNWLTLSKKAANSSRQPFTKLFFSEKSLVRILHRIEDESLKLLSKLRIVGNALLGSIAALTQLGVVVAIP